MLGDRDEIMFSDIALPGKTKRKAASRSFFHILGKQLPFAVIQCFFSLNFLMLQNII